MAVRVGKVLRWPTVQPTAIVVTVDRWSLYRGALVSLSLRWPTVQPTALLVTVDRWSLYRGALVSLRWPTVQPTAILVTVDRWSLYRGALVSLRWPTVHAAEANGDLAALWWSVAWFFYEQVYVVYITGFTVHNILL